MSLAARIGKPSYPSTLIDRPRLYRKLDSWIDARAILLLAPSGYGKSSLISRWIDSAALTAHSAWLSLDERHKEPRQFILHLTRALDPLFPGAFELIQPILDDTDGNAERALNRLFSAFWGHEGSHTQPSDRHTLLVLDDLHRAQSPEVDAALSLILERGPANLHLILLTRHRTTLPLARFFAHGDIVALDRNDLRFTPEEIGTYMQRQGFTHPSETELAQMAERSEGWVTALQLAVLAVDERRTISDLLAVLQSQHVWLAEYLTDEVLKRQEPALSHFLLQTSILHKFNAALCAAVTGENAYAWLDEVARRDLFLISLDERGHWFRYHHLFQELLQQRLQIHFSSEEVADLHRRAATWLVQVGDAPAAVHHLLAAGEEMQATELVEMWIQKWMLRKPYETRSLLASMPDDLISRRSQLMLDRCRLALIFGDKNAATYSQEAKRALQEQRDRDACTDRYHAEWFVLEGMSQFIQRDYAAAAAVARQAETRLADLDDWHLGSLRFLQAHLCSVAGKWTELVKAAEAALTAFANINWIDGTVAVHRQLAIWNMRKGRSDDAARQFQQLFAAWDPGRPRATDDLALAYVMAAENSYWRDQIEEARAYQRLAMELATRLQDPQIMLLARYLSLAYGMEDDQASLDIHEFADHIHQILIPFISDLVIDLMVRFLISREQSDIVWQIALELEGDPLNLPADRARSRLITYLHAYIARGFNLQSATSTLVEALAQARKEGNRFDQVRLLALSAWQELQLNQVTTANDKVLEAAYLAIDTGYLRVVLDIPVLAQLLQEMDIAIIPTNLTSTERVSSIDAATGITSQEKEVLNLLAAGNSYQEISTELVISINTVRSHVRSLYRKLGVNRREQAIRQAVRSGLWASQSSEER